MKLGICTLSHLKDGNWKLWKDKAFIPKNRAGQWRSQCRRGVVRRAAPSQHATLPVGFSASLWRERKENRMALLLNSCRTPHRQAGDVHSIVVLGLESRAASTFTQKEAAYKPIPRTGNVCPEDYSSIVCGWTPSTGFVYGTDCVC